MWNLVFFPSNISPQIIKWWDSSLHVFFKQVYQSSIALAHRPFILASSTWKLFYRENPERAWLTASGLWTSSCQNLFDRFNSAFIREPLLSWTSKKSSLMNYNFDISPNKWFYSCLSTICPVWFLDNSIKSHRIIFFVLSELIGILSLDLGFTLPRKQYYILSKCLRTCSTWYRSPCFERTCAKEF